MPDEELEGQGQGIEEGLNAEEQAMMAEYEAEGELPQGEAEGEGEPEPQAVAPEPPPEAIKVPLHELKEERAKRQDAERKLDLLMQRTNELFGKIDQVTAPAPEQPPDREEDPVGYLTWQNEQLMARLDQQTQTQTQTQQTQAQERAAQQFWNDYNGAINQFAEKTPDYPKAAEFLVNSRRAELEALGVTDPAQQDQILWQDSFQIAAMARERGQNHAEIFYNLAKQRGYQGGQGTGQTPAGSVKPEGTPKPSLDNVRRGTQAATSLSNVGGGEGDIEMTAEALLAMNDDEFAAATRGGKWRKLHGR